MDTDNSDMLSSLLGCTYHPGPPANPLTESRFLRARGNRFSRR